MLEFELVIFIVRIVFPRISLNTNLPCPLTGKLFKLIVFLVGLG